MSRQARSFRPAAVVVALALVAAACGSGESSAPNVSPDDPNGSAIDPATLVVDRVFEAFNTQDAEGVAAVFGDDVGFTLESGEVVFGADAASFWQGFFGVETAERMTDAFHASDGLTYFVTEFSRPAGSVFSLIFDVEMDGERPVRMGARTRNGREIVATREIDNIYQAFNDQDLDHLTEEFEGLTYRSPSGAEFTGAEAAEHWADAFGLAVTRTTSVFSIGDSALEFVTEYTERDSDRSTVYAVEVEMTAGRITSMTERLPER